MPIKAPKNSNILSPVSDIVPVFITNLSYSGPNPLDWLLVLDSKGTTPFLSSKHISVRLSLKHPPSSTADSPINLANQAFRSLELILKP